MMINQVTATFSQKMSANEWAITRLLSLVEKQGGEISNIGLEGDELELVAWVQFPSELSVEWSDRRGWILEVRHRVRRQPDPVKMTKELRFLLKDVPRSHVIVNDPVLEAIVHKVYQQEA